MSREILPSTGDALHGVDWRVQTAIIPGEREKTTRTETGPQDLIAARLAYWRLWSDTNTNIASMTHEEGDRGRASLVIAFEPAISTSDIQQNETYGVQELRAFDVVKDIRCANYFAALTVAQCEAVYKVWEEHGAIVGAWVAKQKALFGHLAHGQESFLETCYEFSQTFQTTSKKALKKSASNPNTVQALPALSPTMQNLVDSLPSGEWLKKPPQAQYLGRGRWQVDQSWHWAPKWSKIYGGTWGL
jgi:hypothetical protein